MAKKHAFEHIERGHIGELEKVANDIRVDLIKMLVEAGSGHSAGPLGMADVFSALYFSVLKHNPQKPNWDERDKLFLSNGHIVPVQYVALAHSGYFPKEELSTLRKINTRLQGHPHVGTTPGIENSGGPLGQGLSQAIGAALAAKMDGKRNWIYCILGDGEQDEGQVWESLMFAGKNKIANLTAITDRNNIQIDGMTEDIMPLEPLREKYESFNWHVIDVDGHNVQKIIAACHEAKAIVEKPVMIIAHTIAGKGVGWMEYDYRWHGNPPGTLELEGDPPKKDQAKSALEELRTLRGKIKGEHE